jgi:hypothetical protein
VHQEFDPYRLSRVRRHIHLLVDPCVSIFTLMEDGLQDRAGAIGDISILPVKRDGVSRGVPVPEAQGALAGRDRELLIEGAVPKRL